MRAKLIQKVKENKWIYNADVKFDKLALLREFEGYSGASLLQLYCCSMVRGTKEIIH